MFGKRVRLFNLLGFQVYADWSWLILFVLITWSLAGAAFPAWFPGKEDLTYWLMGVLGAVTLFVSVVWHELCHSLVARYYGMQMKGITLFLFGGVAEMDEEPPTAKAEFRMALAGPLASVVLALMFYALALAGRPMFISPALLEVFRWAAIVNLALAIFNLIPGFPLDGGRALRAALWYWKDDLRWGTRVAASMGMGFGAVLMGLGFLNLLLLNPVGGLWWILIGMFVRGAAKQSYQQVLVRRMLGGEPVRRFMTADPVTVPPALSVTELIERYLYRHHHKMYPVVEGGDLKGCVEMKALKHVPAERRDSITVAELLQPCGPENTIAPETDAMDALTRMRRNQASRFLVVEDGRLAGILSLKDLLGFLSLKMDLEEESDAGEVAAVAERAE